jgi:hypothetical protein
VRIWSSGYSQTVVEHKVIKLTMGIILHFLVKWSMNKIYASARRFYVYIVKNPWYKYRGRHP